MVTALNVANNILKRGFAENIDISPMKLQKLTYLVYKKYYQNVGQPLFPDRFEVWKYGPVVRDIYEAFKSYKSNAIRQYHKESDGSIIIVDEDKSPQFTLAINETWNKYKKYGGIPLSTMTHQNGTAWYKAAVRKDTYLSDTDIKDEREL